MITRTDPVILQATICGHRDFDSAKVCPCFNAAEEYCKIGF